jgi:phospholipid/cholesterol/gamma-HCH transport system permease protein
MRLPVPPRAFAWVGTPLRRGVELVLTIAALSGGAVAEAIRPAAWRRSARAEFRRALRQSLGGGLGTTLVTAALVGLAMVYQAIYWLGAAGQAGLVGRVLVVVLAREVTPVLVGLVLLGRSGTVAVVEFAAITAGGQIRVLEGQGLDAFRLLVLPRTLAFAVAGFTLGVFFIAAALVTGYLAGAAVDVVKASPGAFLDNVLTAMDARDFAIVPLKLVLIGALVALTAAATGFSAASRAEPTDLLPRGFVRGTLAVLLTSGLLSLAV